MQKIQATTIAIDSKKISTVLFWIFSLFVCALLFVGWRLRDRELLSPKQGTGYLLGVVGMLLMLLLMAYPLRKRAAKLKSFGSIQGWFRFHMILGIIGPLCIMFHANFRLGALNSNVALISMIVVSTSGILGRYFYVQIHYGLYGERATLMEMSKGLVSSKQELDRALADIPAHVKEQIFSSAEKALSPPSSLAQSLVRYLSAKWRVLSGPLRAADLSLSVESGARASALKQVKDLHHHVLRVERFGFYERLFSLWHVLHVPLALILTLAVIVHMISVNYF